MTRKINQERINAASAVDLTVAIDFLNCYWKWSTLGNDRWLHINHNGKDYDFSILEKIECGKKTLIWNDRNSAKQPAEPPRIGIINFIQYLTDTDFYHAVRFLEGCINV